MLDKSIYILFIIIFATNLVNQQARSGNLNAKEKRSNPTSSTLTFDVRLKLVITQEALEQRLCVVVKI